MDGAEQVDVSCRHAETEEFEDGVIGEVFGERVVESVEGLAVREIFASQKFPDRGLVSDDRTQQLERGAWGREAGQCKRRKGGVGEVRVDKCATCSSRFEKIIYNPKLYTIAITPSTGRRETASPCPTILPVESTFHYIAP